MVAFFQELFRTGLYKRTQGRITRQVTFAAVLVGVVWGLWKLYISLKTAGWTAQNETLGQVLQFAVPGALFLLGIWAAYRLVNVPDFADFLISVEAEMNKVSWPTRGELVRSSVVVLVTIFALAAVLFVFDFVWSRIFHLLGVI